ncbi:MAG: GspH/FimT family pseudopilin [Magnetospirillum sp.]|nr:GspH/FimT family pseudopilin [Magnetospirillum sp.]
MAFLPLMIGARGMSPPRVRRWIAVGLLGGALGASPAALDAALVRIKAGVASDEVAAAMKEARALAQSRGQPVRLRVDEGMRSLWVEGGHWRKLPDGVTLAGPKPDGDGLGTILFRPDGSSSGGQVVVGWRRRAVSVLVEPEDSRVRRVSAGAG